MRRNNEEKNLKQGIKQMLDVFHLTKKYEEHSIRSLWPQLVGLPIANRTEDVFIREKTLFVRIESAIVRNEIKLMYHAIIQRINEQYAHELVTEIKFL